MNERNFKNLEIFEKDSPVYLCYEFENGGLEGEIGSVNHSIRQARNKIKKLEDKVVIINLRIFFSKYYLLFPFFILGWGFGMINGLKTNPLLFGNPVIFSLFFWGPFWGAVIAGITWFILKKEFLKFQNSTAQSLAPLKNRLKNEINSLKKEINFLETTKKEKQARQQIVKTSLEVSRMISEAQS